jgi:hypothetical protein
MPNTTQTTTPSLLGTAMTAALALLLFGCGSGELTLGEKASAHDDDAQRIVGGSAFDGLPAVGSLVYNGRQHCTGTVVGPRKVLTAAHCVQGFQASRMRFVIGPSISSPVATLAVSSMQAHPAYNEWNIQNDIALVHLSQDAPVAPMGVVGHMDGSWVGTDLLFVGYGVSNGYNQTGAGIKRAVWMAISRVSQTTFRYDDPHRNTCAGDSGGPAFYRTPGGEFLVAGVTSYGDQYCTSYGVNARVDTYLDFLGLEGGAPSDPCGGETYEGRCDGDTVVWCENGQIHQQDCAASGQACGYSGEHGYYGCMQVQTAPPPPPPTDPCGGETYEGRCDGDTVVWCENELVHEQPCGAGTTCGYSSEHSYYGCVADAPADPCGGETYEGRCDGNTVIWCENDTVMSTSCSNFGGRTCGYSDAAGYYGCL